MGQNWISQNGALMNNEVADALEERELFIVYVNHDGENGLRDDYPLRPQVQLVTFSPRPELYPWVASFAREPGPRPVGPRGRRGAIIPRQALHLFAWDLRYGLTDPRREGEVVHHRNEDKHDSRWKNLGKGTRSAHARAHNLRRQMFAPRERHDLCGLYRPHLPAQVKPRPEMIGMVILPEPKLTRPPSIEQQMKAMEGRLAVRWEALSAELAHLDSRNPIPRRAPRAAWVAPKTRMLGLRSPRLELTPGESVFVLLLAKHGFDMDLVAVDAGEAPELLRLLWRSPAVSQAISNWRHRKRLPLAAR